MCVADVDNSYNILVHKKEKERYYTNSLNGSKDSTMYIVHNIDIFTQQLQWLRKVYLTHVYNIIQMYYAYISICIHSGEERKVISESSC